MGGAKQEIIAALKELAELTLLDEKDPNSFRVRAYERAIAGLEEVGDDVAQMNATDLRKLPGVGKSTAEKIRAYFDTGSIPQLKSLREKYPPSVRRLARVPGLGPKGLARLRSELGIESIEDLRHAIETKRVRLVAGFGVKSEEKLLRALDRMSGEQTTRWPVAEAMALARMVVASLSKVPGVKSIEIAGSLRRLRETIGDIDILVASSNPAPVMHRAVSLSYVQEVLGHGDTKSSFVTATGMQVDVRVVEPENLGAALMYFTGSKGHNIKLRQRALKRGWTLNEYALTEIETGKVVASRTEEEIYRALELPWIPPPMREDSGEVEEPDSIPPWVEVQHLRGDLHVHTNLSGDGHHPLAAMVAEAARRQYRYLAITDHAENLAINGVSREALMAQWEQMAALSPSYPKLRLMRGCELNIGPDGSLDYDQNFRLSLDWCVAAVHSHFDLSREEQTKRVLRAMDDPAVNVIGHLTGRRIGQRPGIELDIDAVLSKAAQTGVALEINSALPRLDMAADILRRSAHYDVTLVISTDAHHLKEMDRTRWGAMQAQRGWVDRHKVANTWSEEKFWSWARKRRAAAGQRPP